jgi:hypothetical protein
MGYVSAELQSHSKGELAMRRGVVYLGGAGRHLMDQTAMVVADRIARSIQHKLKGESQASYRVRLESDVSTLAPDITLDIASIACAKPGGWEPAIDILEVKYLDRFARTFAPLSPLARAARALWVLYRFSLAKAKRSCARAEDGQPKLSREDELQAQWLNCVALGTIGSIFYWVAIGVVAALGLSIAVNAITSWMIIPAVLILVFAEAARKPIFEPFDRWSIETFAGAEYQLNDKRFLAVQNAILDAIVYAHQRDYGAVDLLTFSLGSLLATDAIFPRHERKKISSSGLDVDNWITIGHPYDLIRYYLPNYFDMRQPPCVHYDNWINIVVKDDFLGTHFRPGDNRGIRLCDSEDRYAPDDPVDALPLEGLRQACRKQDRLWLRRIINHRIYWDDEDSRAPTCFDTVVDRAHWMKGVEAIQAAQRSAVDDSQVR